MKRFLENYIIKSATLMRRINLTSSKTTQQKNAEEFWKRVEEAAKVLNIPNSTLWMKELRLLD